MNLKLPELLMKSVYDIVKENFQRVKLKTYAQRVIYCGEHAVSKEEIIKQIQKSVNYANSGYTDVSVTGLLLVYDSYFVHIVEGSEDTIHRHLRFLFNIEIYWIDKMNRLDKEMAEAAKKAAQEALEEGLINEMPNDDEFIVFKGERKLLKRLKILMAYHSITTRLFDGWRAITARPPALVGKLDVHATIDVHMEQLNICLEKLSKLCKLVEEDVNLTFEGLSANDPKMEGLPEVALLDYLLTSKYILDLRQTLALHRRVDDHAFYFELVWPLQTHYTPRHLYKLKIDDSFVEPLPVMWWEKKEEEEGGEEKEDKASSESD